MKTKNIIQSLKQAIEKSEHTQSKIGELSGINKGQISRFMRDERTLTLESAAKIAETLKLELTQKKTRKQVKR